MTKIPLGPVELLRLNTILAAVGRPAREPIRPVSTAGRLLNVRPVRVHDMKLEVRVTGDVVVSFSFVNTIRVRSGD